ncbi:YqgE/AlgH family protein [Ruegeria aquimaris]|uniref:UPF0301 protein OE747_13680 n=1 Tax=Ruegeria aquimaris TaxID=2984333 RepID=A0ABT3AL56_9RHOB|nr:YqgE/AlgH family protein [Ruegeria sp. XHP0148]MCV2889398.1 YqgE/AlgH family protein [Ruegeria sp. XHP0148]
MDLTGKLLIAMPGMGDPRFDRSVIFMCSHDTDGAMGLIVNKPADLRLAELLEQMDLACKDPAVAKSPVRFGGPVETGRGFVLHSSDYAANLHSLKVSDGFSMTATLDILEDIANGRGPARKALMLGYSGWGPGQLEAEISDNGWLTADADSDLVFNTPDGDKWEAALKTLGIDALLLSASAGHA